MNQNQPDRQADHHPRAAPRWYECIAALNHCFSFFPIDWHGLSPNPIEETLLCFSDDWQLVASVYL
jgi:hypothetical protein